MLAIEAQRDHAGAAGAVLAHQQFGTSGVGTVWVVQVVAVDERHNIGILLDAARFPQVGQNWPLVAALL
jgi:hypothetical protein